MRARIIVRPAMLTYTDTLARWCDTYVLLTFAVVVGTFLALYRINHNMIFCLLRVACRRMFE